MGNFGGLGLMRLKLSGKFTPLRGATFAGGPTY
jgi:hypothetical protein